MPFRAALSSSEHSQQLSVSIAEGSGEMAG